MTPDELQSFKVRSQRERHLRLNSNENIKNVVDVQGCHEALMEWAERHEHMAVSQQCVIIMLQVHYGCQSAVCHHHATGTLWLSVSSVSSSCYRYTMLYTCTKYSSSLLLDYSFNVLPFPLSC